MTLNPGEPVYHGSMAVIAPGTGLGEGYLNWNGNHYGAFPFLQKESFLKSFQNKGRFATFLEKIPVHVILNPETALIGAARHGLEAEGKDDG